MKGKAAVTRLVFMATFETGTGISQHEHAGYQGRPALPRLVLEGTSHNGGDADLSVLFLEGAVARTSGATHVRDRPSGALRQQMRAQSHDRKIAIFPKHRGTDSS